MINKAYFNGSVAVKVDVDVFSVLFKFEPNGAERDHHHHDTVAKSPA
jgi:hypothetical protein